jgi:hypothetical protein
LRENEKGSLLRREVEESRRQLLLLSLKWRVLSLVA